jgi:hypothetical protein
MVDVSIYNDLRNPELLDHIQRVGQVLYDRDGKHEQGAFAQ